MFSCRWQTRTVGRPHRPAFRSSPSRGAKFHSSVSATAARRGTRGEDCAAPGRVTELLLREALVQPCLKCLQHTQLCLRNNGVIPSSQHRFCHAMLQFSQSAAIMLNLNNKKNVISSFHSEHGKNCHDAYC